jgi:DNA-binding MarR family transcriptional regulator
MKKISQTESVARPRSNVPVRGIGGLLHIGERAFRTGLQMRLREFRIPISHWFHLSQLWMEDGLTQVELSRRLGIAKASTTAVLVTLKKGGLIRRSVSKGDRRKIHLYLTADGRRLTEKLSACAVAVNVAARAGIADEKVAIFAEVLNAMIANLEGSY